MAHVYSHSIRRQKRGSPMSADLHLVSDTPPLDEVSGRLNITIRKNQLMAAAVKYILEGRDGHMQDRIRTASDASGIPRNLLEVAVSKLR
jgi:hypothetical protein